MDFANLMKTIPVAILNSSQSNRWRRTSPWIEQARGKVVKIVAPMIPNLPGGMPCRVILIERDLNAILASQRQMIARRGRELEQTPARVTRLKQEYLRLIVWTKGFLATRPDTKLMCVDRTAILKDPQSAAEAINLFLGGTLNVTLMSAEVKPELDRHSDPRSRPIIRK